MSESNMIAKRKLAEGKYFLELVKKEQELNNLHYVLSAFLSASHSVMDILLYDFTDKFGFGLDEGDYIDRNNFKLLAKSHKNELAMKFGKWFDAQLGKLSSLWIWKMRNINSHRGYPDVKQTEVAVVISMNPETLYENYKNVSAATHSHSGTISVYGTPSAPEFKTETGTKRFKFDEDPSSKEIWETCEGLYDTLANLLVEAETEFWSK